MSVVGLNRSERRRLRVGEVVGVRRVGAIGVGYEFGRVTSVVGSRRAPVVFVSLRGATNWSFGVMSTDRVVPESQAMSEDALWRLGHDPLDGRWEAYARRCCGLGAARS